MHSLEAYPYLLFSLSLLAIALMTLLLFPRQRRLMLLGGILALPFGALEVLFIPAYWDPQRVTALPFGPEDALFSFSAGLIACQIALRFSRHRLVWRFDAWRLARRYMGVTVLFLVGIVLFSQADVTLMTAVLLSMVCVGGFLVAMRGYLWRVPLTGGVGFAVLYFLLLLGAYSLWPHFAAEWSAEGLWGLRVLNVPLEEIVWALLYGSLYPFGMAFFLSTGTIQEPGRPEPDAPL